MDPLAPAEAARANALPVAVSGLQDATAALRAASLRNLLWTLAFWYLFNWTIAIPFIAENRAGPAVRSVVSFALLLAIPFVLQRRGQPRAAGWVLAVGGALQACAIVAFAQGGIRSVFVILQLAFLVVAILLLGRAGAASVALIFLAFDGWLIWSEHVGRRFPVVFSPSDTASWTIVLFAFLVCAPPLWLAVQRFRNTLAAATVAEERLRFATSQLTEGQLLSRSGTFVSDLTARTSLWSPGVFHILGIPVPDAEEPWMFHSTPRMIRDYVIPENLDLARRVMDGILRGEPQEVKHTVRRPDGELRYMRLRLIPEEDAQGRVTRMRGTVQDETDLQTYAMERQRMLDELRRLTVHSEEVREEERKRIAREIHDELGQQLTGLKMRAAHAIQLAGIRSPFVVDEMSTIGEQLESAIRTVRDIATQLRPPILDRLGLIPALEWLAQEFAENHGMPCHTRFTEQQVDDATATVVFRVAQEALTNVAKHAQATEADLSLSTEANRVRLEVTDNGVGIQASDMGKLWSFGLAGMRERAALAGGSLTISLQEQGGTALILVLPLVEALHGGLWT